MKDYIYGKEVYGKPKLTVSKATNLDTKTPWFVWFRMGKINDKEISFGIFLEEKPYIEIEKEPPKFLEVNE